MILLNPIKVGFQDFKLPLPQLSKSYILIDFKKNYMSIGFYPTLTSPHICTLKPSSWNIDAFTARALSASSMEGA